MNARDLMQSPVLTIQEDASLVEACELFVEGRVNGAPVVDVNDRLVGIVTQQDVLFGTLGRPVQERGGPVVDFGALDPIWTLRVRDVMTSPAVCATEDADLGELCRLMWSLRIHRIPIVREGRVAGMVSSMDVCHAVCEGTLAIPV